MRLFKKIAIMASVAAVYFFAGKFGLRLAYFHPSASPVWPPTGISLAVLALLGRGVWPGIFLGAFLTNVTTAGTFLTSLGIAAGNTLEAVMGAWFFYRYAGGHQAFDRVQNVFRYIFFVVLVSTAVSATVGVTSLALGGFAGWDRYGAIWSTWWLGDMASNLIVAPLILLWALQPLPRLKGTLVLEMAALCALVAGFGRVVFGDWLFFGSVSYPLSFVSLPLLVWAAFRFGRRGAMTTAFAMSAIAIWGTLHGFGPFVLEDPNVSLISLQAFMGVVTFTALVLSASLFEQRRAEAELKRYAEKLEFSNKELEQFAYVASHDLQEPLHKIISFTDLLKPKLGASADPQSLEYFSRIRKAAVRMQRLIEDLLDYSRVTKTASTRQAVDLDNVLKEVLQDMEVRIKELGAQVRANPLPVVNASELSMRQLFQNLIGNALKFSRKNVAPEVRIECLDSGRATVKISIQDNGIGFDEKYLDRIFKPFQRLHSRQEYEGSGIGLAICQKIVQQFGGTLTAKGQLGKGATFIFTLPRKNLLSR